MIRFCVGPLLLSLLLGIARAEAQPLGTFSWQLQPFCNVLTVNVTQAGSLYTLDGFDDQCGAPTRAPLTGTAVPNASGTIAFGLTIVLTPGAAPLHVASTISVATLGGTWRDSVGNTGPFTFTPGAGTGGSPRPGVALPAVIPSSFQLQIDGGFLARGVLGAGLIPEQGPGSRLMWYPGKAAFRAGHVNGPLWDDQNVGLYSVAFGLNSAAIGVYSVALGLENSAIRTATVALGSFSIADGVQSVAIGTRATAGGDRSVVLGSDALTTAASTGSFVYGDGSTTNDVISSVPNQFLVRAAGGVVFWSSPNTTFPTSPGVALFSGAGAWSSLSDANAKDNFRDMAGADVLGKLARMPIREWNYKAQDAAVRHVGPTAQDFHAAFGLGEDALRISTIDADGVALAAIQALEARTRAENEALRAEIDALKKTIAALTPPPR